jgi:hypothetical protein
MIAVNESWWQGKNAFALVSGAALTKSATNGVAGLAFYTGHFSPPFV